MSRDTVFEIITIVAIIVGPVLALFAQRILDNMREKRKRKLALFQTLLTSRATPISIQHVQALNSIELEFYPRKGKNMRVIDAWRIYSDHLNQPRSDDQQQVKVWADRRQDLIVDLLYEMAQCLGYDFEKVMIKRDAYYPTGLTDMENEGNVLRKAVIQVFEEGKSLNVHIDNPQ